MTTQSPPGLLAGKVAIITGASMGLGEAAARYFADAGACVALAARSTKALKNVATRIEENGGTALTVETDVTDEPAVARLVEQTVDHSVASMSHRTTRA